MRCFCRRRERETQSAGRTPLPIVALSANVLDEHVAECTAAGMDAHFCKPLRVDCIERLRRYVARARDSA